MALSQIVALMEVCKFKCLKIHSFHYFNFTQSLLREIGRNLSQELRYLELNTIVVDAESLVPVLNNLEQLETFILQVESLRVHKGIKNKLTSKKWTRLEININGSRNSRVYDFVASCMRANTKLTRLGLTLQSLNHVNDALKELTELRELRAQCHYSSLGTYDVFFNTVTAMSSLRVLLFKNGAVPPLNLEKLTELRVLSVSFELTGYNRSDFKLSSTNLQELCLGDVPVALWAHLLQKDSLRKLAISRPQLDGNLDTLQLLSHAMSSLESLKISHLDSGAEILFSHCGSYLKKLSLQGVDISSYFPLVKKYTPNITHLKLIHTHCREDNLVVLENVKSLKCRANPNYASTLLQSFPNLRKLNLVALYSSQMFSVSLNAICANCPHLSELILPARSEVHSLSGKLEQLLTIELVGANNSTSIATLLLLLIAAPNLCDTNILKHVRSLNSRQIYDFGEYYVSDFLDNQVDTTELYPLFFMHFVRGILDRVKCMDVSNVLDIAERVCRGDLRSTSLLETSISIVYEKVQPKFADIMEGLDVCGVNSLALMDL